MHVPVDLTNFLSALDYDILYGLNEQRIKIDLPQ